MNRSEVAVIDYYFDSTMSKVTVESVIVWMIISAFTAVITYILYKRGKISATTAIMVPILVFYLSFILTITVFERVPRKKMRYELELFWSYRRGGELLWENFWNVVMFVPIGGMTAMLLKKRAWLAGVVGAFISAAIEVTQLLTHRGLFEFDDIFHNTLGAFVGVALFLALNRCLSSEQERWKPGENAGKDGEWK